MIYESCIVDAGVVHCSHNFDLYSINLVTRNSHVGIRRNILYAMGMIINIGSHDGGEDYTEMESHERLYHWSGFESKRRIDCGRGVRGHSNVSSGGVEGEGSMSALEGHIESSPSSWPSPGGRK